MTQREREYERDADPPQRESTQVRWGGRVGRREPDSGLGRTQDHRTWWTGDAWVDPDSFAQKTEQPAGHKRRAGGRSAVKRIPDGTVLLAETISGISHGNVPCLFLMGRIVRRLVVTFRTLIGLRR